MTQLSRISRPIRAWNPWELNRSASAMAILPKVNVGKVAPGITMLTSYTLAICGVAPVEGVFICAVPVGGIPSFLIMLGSQHVQLAPVSSKARTCSIGGTGLLAAL